MSLHFPVDFGRAKASRKLHTLFGKTQGKQDNLQKRDQASKPMEHPLTEPSRHLSGAKLNLLFKFKSDLIKKT